MKITNWCKLYLNFHQSKVNQHTHTSLQNFDELDCRFEHLHVDIVGPLSPSREFIYLLSLHCNWQMYSLDWGYSLDRFNCTNMCQSAFPWMDLHIQHARWDDFGPQSPIHFKALGPAMLYLRHKVLPCYILLSSANVMVERFYSTLKASLMARLRNCHNWMEELPVVMLGLCIAFKEDFGYSRAELVDGTNPQLHGDFSRHREHSNLPFQSINIHHSIEQWKILAELQHGTADTNRSAALDNCT